MARRNSKTKLQRQEEFAILNLVLDKFLWLGTLLIGYGLYLFYQMLPMGYGKSIAALVSGAVILVLFLVMLVQKYEISH